MRVYMGDFCNLVYGNGLWNDGLAVCGSFKNRCMALSPGSGRRCDGPYGISTKWRLHDRRL